MNAFKIDNDIKKSFDGTGRFLISHNYSYIDTKVPATLPKLVNITFSVSQSESYVLSGNSYLDDTSRFHLVSFYEGFHYGLENNYKSGGIMILNKVYNVETYFSNGLQYMNVDGNRTITTNWSSNFSGSTLALFGYGGSLPLDVDLGIIKCSICYIYENDTLLRLMIPINDPNNGIGMYDLVECKLYTNINTSGYFTIE